MMAMTEPPRIELTVVEAIEVAKAARAGLAGEYAFVNTPFVQSVLDRIDKETGSE